MKKVFAIALIVCMMLSVTACSASQNEKEEPAAVSAVSKEKRKIIIDTDTAGDDATALDHCGKDRKCGDSRRDGFGRKCRIESGG